MNRVDALRTLVACMVVVAIASMLYGLLRGNAWSVIIGALIVLLATLLDATVN
jgi:hypothetical protein